MFVRPQGCITHFKSQHTQQQITSTLMAMQVYLYSDRYYINITLHTLRY